MINPFADVDWKPDAAALRAFGRRLVVTAPLFAVALCVLLRVVTGAWPWWPWWIAGFGGSAGILCWLLPRVAFPIYWLWLGVPCAIALVASNVAAILVFVLAVVPTGLLMKLMGRDPLERKFDRDTVSYWKPVTRERRPSEYFRQS